MTRKPVNPKARAALNQMKEELAGELGIKDILLQSGSNRSSRSNGEVGGALGGRMTKNLVEMGEEISLNQYKGTKQ